MTKLTTEEPNKRVMTYDQLDKSWRNILEETKQRYYVAAGLNEIFG